MHRKYSLLYFVLIVIALLLILFIVTGDNDTDVVLTNWLFFRYIQNQDNSDSIKDTMCVTIPYPGEKYLFGNYLEGVNICFKADFNLPHVNKDSYYFIFGGCDDKAELYINNTFIKTLPAGTRLSVIQLPDILKKGKNEVKIKLLNESGLLSLYQPLVITKNKYIYYQSNVEKQQIEFKDTFLEWDIEYTNANHSLQTLQNKLVYFAKKGITTIVFRNIFYRGELGFSFNDTNDEAVKDYFNLNPKAGTTEELTSLVAAAHSVGLKVVLEFIPDRLSWDSDLFIHYPELFATNEERNFISPDCLSPKSVKLNTNSHEIKKIVLRIMKYWVQTASIDGYYIRYSTSYPLYFWKAVKKKLEQYKPIIFITDQLFYNNETTFDFYFTSNICVLTKILQSNAVSLKKYIEEESRIGIPMQNFIRRNINTNANTKTEKEFRQCMLLQMLLPGTPYIEYGNDFKQYEDMLNIRNNYLKESVRDFRIIRFHNNVDGLQYKLREGTLLLMMNNSDIPKRVPLVSRNLTIRRLYVSGGINEEYNNENIFVLLNAQSYALFYIVK